MMIKSSSKFLVTLKGLLSLFLILFLLFFSWVLWERNRDALASIDYYSGKVELSHDTAYHTQYFLVDEYLTFEIGGQNKSNKQIKDLKNAYINRFYLYFIK